jgi:hypothetical protein
VQLDANGAGDVALRACDVGGDVLVVGAEPEAVVDQFRVFDSDLLLQAHLLLGERHAFERAMRGVEDDTGRRFVDFAAFDADEAVFDGVDAADAVFAAEFVQAFDDGDRAERLTVEAKRHA